MRSSEIFKEYVWLVNTIRRAGRITFEELSLKWEGSALNDGKQLARSTFNRHRSAVERMFGIVIDCDRGSNTYYIADAEDVPGKAVRDWMVSTLAVNNLVVEGRSIQNRIHLEKIPFAGETLETIISAMKEGREVDLVYRSYGAASRNLSVRPYAIRLYRQRWYLLAHFDDKFRLFSFDRVLNASISDNRFEMPGDFDTESYFEEFYGMMTDHRVPCQRIVIRAFGQERYYLRDLPLHHSQTLIGETGTYVDFELYLRPTADFMAAIFSRAGWVQIVSPSSLQQTLKDWARTMVERLEDAPDSLPQWK